MVPYIKIRMGLS